MELVKNGQRECMHGTLRLVSGYYAHYKIMLTSWFTRCEVHYIIRQLGATVRCKENFPPQTREHSHMVLQGFVANQLENQLEDLLLVA